jgi:hypothetical protein
MMPPDFELPMMQSAVQDTAEMPRKPPAASAARARRSSFFECRFEL